MKKLIAATLLALACWAIPINWIWAKTTDKPKLNTQTKIQAPEPYVSQDIIIKDNAIQPLRPSRTNGYLQPQNPTTTRHLQPHDAISKPAASYGGRHYPDTCESYREIVQRYFGVHTDQALFVASKESGCQNIRSHRMNSNGTWDYCLFQINNEPSALDIATCVRRAWEKFKGSNFTWRQWYAVCAPKTHQPKYPNIKCQ